MDRMTRPANLPAMVADELRRQIGLGELRPGQQLPGNRELAATFDVSMGSIREAMSMLSSAGLIETRAGRGTFVAAVGSGDGIPGRTRAGVAISPVLERKQVEELIEAREILEGHIIRLAAQRASTEQIEQLRAALGRMQQGVGDPASYSEADVAFHMVLAQAAGNAVLLDAMTNIRSSLKREMELSAEVGARRHGNLQFSIDSHECVIDAIEAGDADAAHAEMASIMNRHHGFVLGLYAEPVAVAETTDGTGEGKR